MAELEISLMEDYEGTNIRARGQVVSIPEILENIFQFLSLPELKSARLVSTIWRDSARPSFQRKSVVNLDEGRKHPFLEAFATVGSRQVVFRNYKLLDFILDKDSEGEMDGVMGGFFEKFGPSMESLELNGVTMVGVEVVRDILFNLTPKLKKIAIRKVSFWDKIGTSYDYDVLAPDPNVKVNQNLKSFLFSECQVNFFYFYWEDVFTAFPNIKDLTVYNLTVLDTKLMLETVSSVRTRNPNCFQLEKLDIFKGLYFLEEEIQPATMDILISLKLPLKELSMDLGESDTDKIAELLHQQMDIKKLFLYRGCQWTESPFQLVFNHLRHLEITDTIVTSMEFIQFMPNLTTLILCDPCICRPPSDQIDIVSDTDMYYTQMPIQMKIRTLKIEYEITTEDVKKLIFWLPNVLKANLYLNNRGFRVVCGGWKKLEELEVYGGQLTTEGITGIYELKVRNRREDTDIPERECHLNNITCLKNLRQFVMVNYNKPTAIDDFTVEEGFLQLPCLNYLDICSFDISMDGWTKLFNWDQLRILKASNGDRDWEGVKKFTKI